MDDSLVLPFMHWLQSLSPVLISLVMFIVVMSSILLMFRYFGALGLVAYNALAVVVGNIQVLKVVQFSFLENPLALGTIVFSSTFLVSDIMTEHYGKWLAQKSVFISIFTQIMMTIIIILTIGYGGGPLKGEVLERQYAVQGALDVLFIPSVRLFIASLIAYSFSQLLDIYIFQKIRDLTHNKLLWLRVNISTLVGGLLDNIIFSLLAWVIFSPDPVSFQSLVLTYILGSYIARVIMSICTTPVIYISYELVPKKPIFDLSKL